MAPHPALAVHGALARGVFAVVVLISLAILFAPASDVPSAPPGVDTLLLVYAAVSEVLQGLAVLDRSVSLADWIADAVGVLVGLAVWELVARRSASPR
jgi:VanZ family protein